MQGEKALSTELVNSKRDKEIIWPKDSRLQYNKQTGYRAQQEELELM